MLDAVVGGGDMRQRRYSGVVGANDSVKKSKRVWRAQVGWAAGIGGFVVLAAIAIVFAPRMLVQLNLLGPFFDPEPQPLSLSPSEYVEAITAARTGVLFAAGGVLAAITLYFTRVRDAVAEDKQEDDRARLDLDRDANATDRYTKAVAQLGETAAAVQLGGIYALERVADDSRRDRQTVLDVLVAFVRAQAEEVPGLPPHEAQRRPPVSLDAALRVVARLTASAPSAHRINWRSRVLAHGDLSDANLGNGNFHRTSFNETRLTGARLRGAHIQEASFYRANLDGADLRDTQGWMPDQFDDIFSWDDDTLWPKDFDTSRISESRYAARDYAARLESLRASQAPQSAT